MKILLTLLSATIVYGDGIPSNSISGCNTARCNDTARHISSMMNTTTDPCQNPYLYFCGAWIRNFQLPDDESSWTVSFTSVYNKTREHLRMILESVSCPNIASGTSEDSYDDMLSCYYRSCVDVERLNELGIGPLVEQLKFNTPFLLERVATPEIIDEEEHRLTPSIRMEQLSDRLAKLESSLGVSAWLQLSVDPSVLSDSGSYALYLSESGLGLQYHQYEQKDAVDAYVDYMKTLLATFTAEVQGISLRNVTDLERQLKSRVMAVLELEQDVKGISLTPEQQRDPQITINLLSKEELEQALSGALDINIVLQPLMDLVANDAEEEDKNHFIVDNPLFIDNLAALIKRKWSWGAIHDYLLIKTIRSFVGGLSQPYRDALDEFHARACILCFSMSGVIQQPRWKRCQLYAQSDLGWIMSLRYVNSIETPGRRKEIAKNVVAALKEVYGEVIQNTSWMDHVTKVAALDKLRATKYKLAFPDWIQTDSSSYFLRYYGKANVHAMREFIPAVIHLSHERARFQMSRLSKQKDNTEWDMYPQDVCLRRNELVNAYFDPLHNEIVFPLSILQDPFLRVWTECKHGQHQDCRLEENAFMQILTFGGLGSIVGHELTHGFDDTGRQFSPTGQFIDWWSPKSAEAFNKEAQCMVDQYSKYALRLHRPSRTSDEWILEDIPVSGKLTIGENIADNGGIKLAYLALWRLHPEYFTAPIVPNSLRDMGLNSVGLFSAAFAQIWCNVAREKAILKRITGDTHSPSSFRVLGTLTNLEAYSTAFGCHPGSHVNPSWINSDSNKSDVSHHSMLANGQTNFPGQGDFNKIIFDPVATVVYPKIKNRCQVW